MWMRVFRLPTDEITAHESDSVAMDFLPRVGRADQAHVHIARIGAGGTLGEHRAPVRQIFAVISGSGQVRTSDGPRKTISEGHAVIWEPGEVHQTWASTDMVVVIVETTGEVDFDENFEEA